MTPRISVITVTYHATPLEYLYLWSLAASGLKHSEVIIVDNTGKDAILLKIKEKYPFVRIIHNTENEGFGRACNRGFAEARGDIALFLNPDTIVPEDFEDQILEFFNTHPRCGAMGAMMIDGQGHFLPESKRNFPTPAASFLKFTGIYKIISPQRKNLSYYAAQNPPETSVRVDVLSGAFMAVTRKAMEATGGFDPRFFMYSEDIDLSLQIAKARFEVWYNPSIKIIHFKGETSKRSKHYPVFFFNSMKLFYQKYYDAIHSPGHALFINTAINILKISSLFQQILKKHSATSLKTDLIIHSDSAKTVIKKLNNLKTCKSISINNSPKAFHLLSTSYISPKQLIAKLSDKPAESSIFALYHDEAKILFQFSNKNNFVRIFV